MTSWLAFFACAMAPVPQDSRSDYFPPNLYLVLATTVEVWPAPDGGGLRGRLRITDVVAGPRSLAGREFQATTELLNIRYRNAFLPSDTIVENLQKNVEGLWWVYDDPKNGLEHLVDGKTVDMFSLRTFPYQRISGVPVPFKQSGRTWDDIWKEGDAFAKVVASVYAAKSDTDRRILLERYAEVERTPVGTWAMSLLARGNKQDAIKYFRNLAKREKLERTVSRTESLYQSAAKARLDDLLCILDEKGWNRCVERKEFLSRWLSSSAPDEHFFAGCLHVRDSMPTMLYVGMPDSTSRTLGVGMLADVVRPLVAHEDELSLDKILSLNQLIFGSNCVDSEIGDLLDFLADVARVSRLEELRGAALQASRNIQASRDFRDK